MFHLMFAGLLQDLPDWLQLNQVLLWLVAGGSAIAVNALFSLLVEHWTWFHSIKPNIKLLLSLVVSILIGGAAYYLLSLPDVITIVQPYYALIVTMVLAWLGSQVTYLKAKNAGVGVKAKK